MTESSPPSSSLDRPEMLVAQEVATWLRISLATVYDWCARQRIPHLKMEGVIRFRRQAVEQWLQDQSHPGTAPATDDRPAPAKAPTLSRQALRAAGQRVVRRAGHPHAQGRQADGPRPLARRA